MRLTRTTSEAEVELKLRFSPPSVTGLLASCGGRPSTPRHQTCNGKAVAWSELPAGRPLASPGTFDFLPRPGHSRASDTPWASTASCLYASRVS